MIFNLLLYIVMKHWIIIDKFPFFLLWLTDKKITITQTKMNVFNIHVDKQCNYIPALRPRDSVHVCTQQVHIIVVLPPSNIKETR